MKKATILLVSIFTFIILSIIFVHNFDYAKISFEAIGLLSILLYLWLFLSYYIKTGTYFDFYTMFVLFSYFFYFGQYFVALVGGDLSSGTTLLTVNLPTYKVNETAIFIMKSMLLFHIGALISQPNSKLLKSEILCNSNNCVIENKTAASLRFVGVLLFAISIIPSLIIITNNIKITLTYGYGAIFTSDYYIRGGFNSIIRFVSSFTIPSLTMMVISFRNKKGVIIINAITFIFFLLYFFSGSRLSGIMFFISFLFIKHYWYSPFIKRDFIKLFILGTIFIIFMSLISSIRNTLVYSYNILDLAINALEDIIKNNFILKALRETGFTLLATATVLTYCPKIVPYNYGLSYLSSFMQLIPNLFWEVNPFVIPNTDMVFKNFLTQYGGIGSSFIAEAYYNFGYYSICIMPLFGWMLGKLATYMKVSSAKNNVYGFYFSIYIFQVVLFYVRSDTISFFRNTIYYGLVPILIAKMLYYISKKRQV